MTYKDDEPIVGMWEVLDVLEAAIASADAAKRDRLAEMLDGYHEDCSDGSLGVRSALGLHSCIS